MTCSKTQNPSMGIGSAPRHSDVSWGDIVNVIISQLVLDVYCVQGTTLRVESKAALGPASRGEQVTAGHGYVQ